MDKRKFNKGKIGNKGGRKPKSEELRLVETLDKYVNPDKAFSILAELIENKDKHALKLWMEYRYGKPKEVVTQINIDADIEDIDYEELSTEALNEIASLGQKKNKSE
jgi:hypothetical protein